MVIAGSWATYPHVTADTCPPDVAYIQKRRATKAESLTSNSTTMRAVAGASLVALAAVAGVAAEVEKPTFTVSSFPVADFIR